MCYNCGCGLPDEDHGRGHAGGNNNGKAITTRTFSEAAKAFDMEFATSKSNTHDLFMSEQIKDD